MAASPAGTEQSGDPSACDMGLVAYWRPAASPPCWTVPCGSRLSTEQPGIKSMSSSLSSPLLRPGLCLLVLTLGLACAELRVNCRGRSGGRPCSPRAGRCPPGGGPFQLAAAPCHLSAGRCRPRARRYPDAAGAAQSPGLAHHPGVASGAQLALMMVTLLAPPPWLLIGRGGSPWPGKPGHGAGLRPGWRRQLNPVVIVFAGAGVKPLSGRHQHGIAAVLPGGAQRVAGVGSGSLAQNSWAASAICCHGCCWPRCWRRCWCARWQCWSWTMPGARSLGSSRSTCDRRPRPRGLHHRLRGERGGADPVLSAGGAAMGAAAGVRKLAQRLLGPSSAPCCWRPPICCCRP